ncbi:MAG: M23 family metallopeptidase [Oscillospiraceae bacterium]
MRYPFNASNRLTQGWSTRHYGLDLVGDADKTVCAVVGGKVLQSRRVYTGRTAEWGNYVSVQGADGNTYYYCHLQSRAVSRGQTIAEGETLGIMGNTGKSYGAHLHLQIRNKAGREINVADMIGMPNVCGTYAEGAEGVQDNDVVKLLIGYVSRGDRAAIERTASELKVPCVVQNDLKTQGVVKLLVGGVSRGDRLRFEEIARAMAVPCEVV